jgi:hypothetical protein
LFQTFSRLLEVAAVEVVAWSGHYHQHHQGRHLGRAGRRLQFLCSCHFLFFVSVGFGGSFGLLGPLPPTELMNI